ncbi:MAG: exodeoxyribonuclease III [Polyangiales bacterium]
MAKKKAPLRIYSWNVNGIRSVAKKGFLDWLGDSGGHVIGLQETRAREDQLEPELLAPAGYHAHYVAAERPGYSGVGLLSKRKPDSVETRLGVDEFDTEGRLQIARYGELVVVNCYFPNGSGKDRDNSRVPYKLDFYRKLFAVLEPERARGASILVMGDFNTAHRPIDLARPKQNEQTSGFLAEEREELDRWLRSGWIDTFRHFEKGEGHYTWWSQRFGVREKNIGWRIDYVLASEGAMAHVRDAGIHPHVKGSDHCPIHVDLDPKVLGDERA